MREKLEIRRKEKQAYFKDNSFDEILNIQKERAVFRVFENSKLGIYYMVNYIDDEDGYNLAQKNLRYDYEHTTTLNTQSNVIAMRSGINERQIVNTVEYIGKTLMEFSKDIQVLYKNTNIRYTLTNINKLHMNFEDERNLIEIIVNETKFSFSYRKIDEDKALEDIKLYINAVLNKDDIDIKDIVKKNLDIIFPTNVPAIYDFFEDFLSCEKVITKGLKEKKLFSEKLNLYTSLAYEDTSSEKYGILPSFDWEGSYASYYRTILIEDGKIIRPYANKDESKKYGVDNTCCAYAVKEDYPQCKLLGAFIQSDDNKLKTMTDYAVLIEDVSSKIEDDIIIFEVKEAYLYDKKTLSSKIKPFTFRVNAFEMFGGNFLGVSKDYLFNSDLRKAIVFNIKNLDLL